MSNETKVHLNPMYTENNKDFIFKDNNSGEFIKPETATFTEDGSLLNLRDQDGVLYPAEYVEYCRYMLNVPGLGYITSGSRIVYENKDYVLLFGWHTNISNQTIYSWFLQSLEESIPDKTVYLDMIDKIDMVHFR